MKPKLSQNNPQRPGKKERLGSTLSTVDETFTESVGSLDNAETTSVVTPPIAISGLKEAFQSLDQQFQNSEAAGAEDQRVSEADCNLEEIPDDDFIVNTEKTFINCIFGKFSDSSSPLEEFDSRSMLHKLFGSYTKYGEKVLCATEESVTILKSKNCHAFMVNGDFFTSAHCLSGTPALGRLMLPDVQIKTTSGVETKSIKFFRPRAELDLCSSNPDFKCFEEKPDHLAEIEVVGLNIRVKGTFNRYEGKNGSFCFEGSPISSLSGAPIFCNKRPCGIYGKMTAHAKTPEQAASHTILAGPFASEAAGSRSLMCQMTETWYPTSSGKTTQIPLERAISTGKTVFVCVPFQQIAVNSESYIKSKCDSRNIPFKSMFTDSHFVNKVEGMGVIVCTPRSLCFALSEGTVNPKDSYIMIDEAHINTLWQRTVIRVCIESAQHGELMSATKDGQTTIGNQHYVHKTEREWHWTNCVNELKRLPSTTWRSNGHVTAIIVPRVADVLLSAKQIKNQWPQCQTITVYGGKSVNMAEIQECSAKGPCVIIATPVIENGVNLPVDTLIDSGLRVHVDYKDEIDKNDGMRTIVKQYIVLPYSVAQKGQALARVGRQKQGEAHMASHTIASVPRLRLDDELAIVLSNYFLCRKPCDQAPLIAEIMNSRPAPQVLVVKMLCAIDSLKDVKPELDFLVLLTSCSERGLCSKHTSAQCQKDFTQVMRLITDPNMQITTECHCVCKVRTGGTKKAKVQQKQRYNSISRPLTIAQKICFALSLTIYMAHTASYRMDWQVVKRKLHRVTRNDTDYVDAGRACDQMQSTAIPTHQDIKPNLARLQTGRLKERLLSFLRSIVENVRRRTDVRIDGNTLKLMSMAVMKIMYMFKHEAETGFPTVAKIIELWCSPTVTYAPQRLNQDQPGNVEGVGLDSLLSMMSFLNKGCIMISSSDNEALARPMLLFSVFMRLIQLNAEFDFGLRLAEEHRGVINPATLVANLTAFPSTHIMIMAVIKHYSPGWAFNLYRAVILMAELDEGYDYRFSMGTRLVSLAACAAITIIQRLAAYHMKEYKEGLQQAHATLSKIVPGSVDILSQPVSTSRKDGMKRALAAITTPANQQARPLVEGERQELSGHIAQVAVFLSNKLQLWADTFGYDLQHLSFGIGFDGRIGATMRVCSLAKIVGEVFKVDSGVVNAFQFFGRYYSERQQDSPDRPVPNDDVPESWQIVTDHQPANMVYSHHVVATVQEPERHVNKCAQELLQRVLRGNQIFSSSDTSPDNFVLKMEKRYCHVSTPTVSPDSLMIISDIIGTNLMRAGIRDLGLMGLPDAFSNLRAKTGLGHGQRTMRLFLEQGELPLVVANTESLMSGHKLSLEVSCFPKPELLPMKCGEPKVARPIMFARADQRLSLGMVGGQLTKVIGKCVNAGKNLPFITGKGVPRTFATTLGDACEQQRAKPHKCFLKMDLVKCDGHVNRRNQMFCQMVRRKVYMPEMHGAITAYYETISDVDVPIYGHTLKLHGQRMSGSPETSTDNTLISYGIIVNAMLDCGLNIEDFILWIESDDVTIYGDTISQQRLREHLIRTARAWGHELINEEGVGPEIVTKVKNLEWCSRRPSKFRFSKCETWMCAMPYAHLLDKSILANFSQHIGRSSEALEHATNKLTAYMIEQPWATPITVAALFLLHHQEGWTPQPEVLHKNPVLQDDDEPLSCMKVLYGDNFDITAVPEHLAGFNPFDASMKTVIGDVKKMMHHMAAKMDHLKRLDSTRYGTKLAKLLQNLGCQLIPVYSSTLALPKLKTRADVTKDSPLTILRSKLAGYDQAYWTSTKDESGLVPYMTSTKPVAGMIGLRTPPRVPPAWDLTMWDVEPHPGPLEEPEPSEEPPPPIDLTIYGIEPNPGPAGTLLSQEISEPPWVLS